MPPKRRYRKFIKYLCSRLIGDGMENEMFYINKITSGETIDYAAGELKKYLRMMMPEGGDVIINYAPEAKDGFRLGLMQDLGLDVSDVKDTELDDIIYIDCDTESGIIAGDNPRSVLIAVYEYLRKNGCRWILPGIDGEYIPMQNIIPVKLRFVPSLRYRGWVSEGTEFQQSMIESVELAPKLGMNTFMVEFKFPKSYYERYYNHDNNTIHRQPEPIAPETILQWKRQLETEIAKRGLQYHDMGHGFTYEPLGIECLDGWNTEYDERVDSETRELLAEINGERKIQYYPINTNLCMSNPRARKKVADYVVDYSKKHSNVDYLHVWLADANNNHCECAECVKKRPSDWYVILLNDIDNALAGADLPTRIVFIAYMDTAWAPEVETINNPDRFTLMIAPITRRYDITLPPEGVVVATEPYVRNKLKMPSSLEAYFAHFNEWKKTWSGANISFEYHFWRAMWRDVSGLNIAKRLNEDVKVYSKYGVDGILEDGSQRCFFPTGLALYVYARSMFDKSLSYETIANDYFKTAFGDAWRQFYTYLEKLDKVFDYRYMIGRRSANSKVGTYYNPDMAKQLEKVDLVVEEGLELIKSHYNSERRVGTVSVRLLEYHAEYVKLLARCYIAKAKGDDKGAEKALDHLSERMGRHEVTIERYYDHCLMVNANKVIFVRNVTHNEYMDVEKENEE